jgi:hypothetical protein
MNRDGYQGPRCLPGADPEDRSGSGIFQTPQSDPIFQGGS